jgi:hypothetical protein
MNSTQRVMVLPAAVGTAGRQPPTYNPGTPEVPPPAYGGRAAPGPGAIAGIGGSDMPMPSSGNNIAGSRTPEIGRQAFRTVPPPSRRICTGR